MTKQGAVLTATNIKYLLAILTLSPDGEPVRCVAVARRLGVSRPSAHRMLGLLRQQKLVCQEESGGITLTREGRDVSERYAGYYREAEAVLGAYIPTDADISSAICSLLAELSERQLGQMCKKIRASRKLAQAPKPL